LTTGTSWILMSVGQAITGQFGRCVKNTAKSYTGPRTAEKQEKNKKRFFFYLSSFLSVMLLVSRLNTSLINMFTKSLMV